MKCLILGANGFVGSHVVDAFLAEGYSVTAMVRKGSNLSNLHHCLDRIKLLRGDLRQTVGIERAVEGVDVLANLAWGSTPASSNEDPVLDVESNLVANLNVISTAVKARVRRYIFASSGGTVYGAPQSVPVSESHPTSPICSYGITKLATEKYLALNEHLHGLPATSLRIGNPYGERQQPYRNQGVLAVFIEKILCGQPLEVWGDGTVARDFLYVKDLAQAFVKAAAPQAPTGIYNIGSGRATTLNTIIDALRGLVPAGVDVRYKPGRKLDVPVSFLDCTKAEAALDWTAKMDLQSGILHTYQWMASQRNADGMVTHSDAA